MPTGLRATVKARRHWHSTVFYMLSDNNCQLRMLYPAKLVFKNEELDIFRQIKYVPHTKNPHRKGNSKDYTSGKKKWSQTESSKHKKES